MGKSHAGRLGLMEECDLQSQLDGVGECSSMKGLYIILMLNVYCFACTLQIRRQSDSCVCVKGVMDGNSQPSALLLCESPQRSNLPLLMSQAFHWIGRVF